MAFTTLPVWRKFSDIAFSSSAPTRDSAGVGTVQTPSTASPTYSTARAWCTRSRRAYLLILALVIILSVSVVRIRNIFVHVTRPLWDRAGLHRSHAFQRVPRIADTRTFNGTAADCRRFGLTPFVQPIGVYDMLLFDSELDMLEMHLQELAPVVTKFVIAESPVTFPGVPKPLHFGSIYRNQSHPEYERFRRFESQIVHVVVDRDRMLSLRGAWDREGYSRELLQQTLRTQTDLRAGDIIMSNDVDEIARASSLDLLRQCHFPPTQFPVVFESQNFIYSFEFMDYRPAFNYAFKYNGNTVHVPRGSIPATILTDAGWHCSWCFRYMADVVHKIESFSHQEYNWPHFKNPLRLQKLICNGDDLFDQWNEFYDFRSLFTTIIFGESVRMPATYRDLPSIVHLKSEHYKYLLPGHCWRADVPQPILHV